MSTNAIEKALWQIVTNPGDAERFRADTRSYLSAFRLDAAEQSMLAAMDVGRLAKRDVSHLLLMMAFSTLNGFDKLPDYMQSMAKAHAPSPN